MSETKTGEEIQGEIGLLPGERIDRLGYKGLRIIQNPTKFKFTIDAFLLTGFIQPKAHESIIDLGTGGGVLPLLLAGDRGVASVRGLEIQPELVEMARRSVQLNGLEANIRIIEGDIRELPPDLPRNSFDYVISNPPFFPVERGVVSENDALALAKFEICCTLKDVVTAAKRLVRGNGRVAFIYPVDRLPELIAVLMEASLRPVRMRFIHPRPNTGSNLFLIEARPGRRGSLTVLRPLFIYDGNNEYTEEMNQIFGLSGDIYQKGI